MGNSDQSQSQFLSGLARSGVLVSGFRVGVRGLSVIRLLILARLLSPTDFGIGMLAILVVTSLRRLSEPGFHEALIYIDDADVGRYFDTILGIRGLLGLSVTALVYLLAPVATEFFAEPALTDILRVAILATLFRSLRNPGVVYFEKDLDFRRYISYNGLSELAGVLCAVGVAIVVGNYWALIAGLLALEITRTVLSYVLHPARPHPNLETDLARELFGYGRWILGSGLLSIAVTKVDDFFVGKVLGTSALGFYQLAFRISQLPVSEITQTITTVGFPALSNLTSVEERANYHRRFIQVTAVISFPLSAGVILMAQPFVVGVLGSKWLPAVLPMQILAIYGAIRAINGVNGSLSNSIGRPDINTKSMVIKLAITLAVLYPLALRFGTAGVALATTLPLLVNIPYEFYAIEKEVEFQFTRNVFGAVVTPFVGTIVMSGTVFGIGKIVPEVYVTPGAAVIWLAAGSLIGMCAYIITTLSFDYVAGTGLVSGVQFWSASLRSN